MSSDVYCMEQRELCKTPHIGEWCKDRLWAPGWYQGWGVVEKYIISGHKIMHERTNRDAQALYLSAGYSDLKRHRRAK